jgi:glutamyl-tRNA synthetase
VVAAVTDYDVAALEAAIIAWLAKEGLELKDVAQAARVALTGRTASPGLYEVLSLLGKDRSVARLDHGLELAARAGV